MIAERQETAGLQTATGQQSPAEQNNLVKSAAVVVAIALQATLFKVIHVTRSWLQV